MTYTNNGYNLEGGGHDWNPPAPPVKKASPGGSPGLLTSTGGLFGATGLLLVPMFDTKINKYCFVTYNPYDFNCEEDCIYYFRNEDVEVGRDITVHKAVIVYREIGKCKITIGCTAYRSSNDTFKTRSQTKVLGKINPDGKIHSIDFNFKVTGERPQLFISRKADSGPFSLISATMVGDADEKEQL